MATSTMSITIPSLLVYLLTWCVYLVVMHALSRRRHLHLGIVSASHFVPTVIALLMTGIFLIGPGTTIAQFAAGSESATRMWRLWFHLWPILLLMTGASVLIHFIWIGIACFVARYRKWLPVTVGGFIMSVFGFFTVAWNSPDA